MTAPILLALDPSFTATGWVAVDVRIGEVTAAGLVRTKPPSAAERLTAAEANGRRGLQIRRGVVEALRYCRPAVVVQEGNAGSQSAKAAAALARAQQACLDAVDAELGALPILLTPQAIKKHCVQRLNASKEDLERAARARWGASLEIAIMRAGIRGKVVENVFDAACVAATAWDLPSVGGLRALATSTTATGGTP